MPTITFSGLASGLDTSSWVEALVSVKQTTISNLQSKLSSIQKKQSTVSSLQASFSSLRSSLEKLTDSKFCGALDVFANNTAKSSDEKIFTATASQNAARMSYEIKVEQLATKTIVASDKTVSAVASDETKVSDIGINKGSVTAYVNGVKNTINIEEDDTVQDLKARFSAAGINLEINEEGKLSLSAVNDGDEIMVGATNDSSNFKSILGLEVQEDGSYLSNTRLYKAASTSKVMESNLFKTYDENGNSQNTTVTAGTFTIGDAEFTINENTTINDIISKINNTEDAHATAYWDSANAKLVLTSTIEGQSYMNIEAGTSNFTDVMGFTKSSWEEGNLTSTALNTDVQTLGENAILYINGSKVTSSSNVVSSDVSRVEGVTINLHAVSTEESGTTTLNVEQDMTKVVDAVKDVVNKYNSLMDSLDKLTKSGGELYGDTSLNSIKRSLRSLITSSTGKTEDPYTMLNQVGVSTAAIGATISEDTDKISLDENDLKQALQENSDAVKKLFIGSESAEDGLLARIESIVEGAVSSTGYFTTMTNTLKSDVQSYKDRITTQTTKVANYKANLEAKFSAMEKTISSLQNSYSNYL